jgi:hypothetical protein
VDENNKGESYPMGKKFYQETIKQMKKYNT